MRKIFKKLSNGFIIFLLVALVLFCFTACSFLSNFDLSNLEKIEQIISAVENFGDSSLDINWDDVNFSDWNLSDFDLSNFDVSSFISSITDEKNTVDSSEESDETTPDSSDISDLLDEDGIYSSKDEVALYIHQYGKLPSNYITKDEAEELGWSSGKKLNDYAPGKCIGGDYFGNYEQLLPAEDGRTYHECDIDTLGQEARGAKRIVYSNDGLIYYTDDHYDTFTRLY